MIWSPHINFAPHDILQDRTRAGEVYDTYRLYRSVSHTELAAVITQDATSLPTHASRHCCGYKPTSSQLLRAGFV